METVQSVKKKRNYFYETNLEKMKESIDLFCKVK
jgi:hypothetical protein